MTYLKELGLRAIYAWPLLITLVACSLLNAGEKTTTGSLNYQKYQGEQIKIIYSFKDCQDIDDYRWSCNKVIFEPQITKGNKTSTRLLQ